MVRHGIRFSQIPQLNEDFLLRDVTVVRFGFVTTDVSLNPNNPLGMRKLQMYRLWRELTGCSARRKKRLLALLTSMFNKDTPKHETCVTCVGRVSTRHGRLKSTLRHAILVGCGRCFTLTRLSHDHNGQSKKFIRNQPSALIYQARLATNKIAKHPAPPNPHAAPSTRAGLPPHPCP